MTIPEKKISLWFILGLMCLPMLCFFGVKTDASLYGVDPISPLPELNYKTWKNKQYQRRYEQYWNSHFAFRKSALRFKNQLYSWGNFYQFHSGSNKVISQGKNQYLFTKRYFTNAFTNSLKMENLVKLVQIKTLTKKNIYLVLAPNKATTYPNEWPFLYKYFYPSRFDSYGYLKKEAESLGLKVFDGQRLANLILNSEQIEPFSKTGVHWNLYGAGRTVQESIKQFNLGAIRIKKITDSNVPFYTERDIANLLNLSFKYSIKKPKYYRPVFESVSPIRTPLAIIGNSFSSEYAKTLRDIGCNVYHIVNRALSRDDIKTISQLNNIIFVYTNDAFDYDTVLRLQMDSFLDQWKNKNTFFFNQKSPAVVLDGFHDVELWGRWTNCDTVTITLHPQDLVPGKVIIFPKVHALVNNKNPLISVNVSINEHHIDDFKFTPTNNEKDLVLHIPNSLEHVRPLQITFKISGTTKPSLIGMGKDNRTLGLAFSTLRYVAKDSELSKH